LLDVTTFRIVQEGLVNALRHSNPTYVTISVSTDAGANSNLVVEVVNDGEGPGAVEPGFDLTEMRERVHAAGGALRVGTVPGQVFTVRASLPLTFSNSVQNHKIATMVGL
jgi:two-component system sensor histidine kinase UhpB